MTDLIHSKLSIRSASKDLTSDDDFSIQIVPKTTIDGFTFNVLCVGRTACGKSSLIESLFNVKLNSKISMHESSRVDLKHKFVDFSENGIHLKLTVIETASFGDQIDTTDSYQPIVNYLDEQFQLYLDEELRIQRNLSNYRDTRVHVCLYFLNPNGHSIKELDLITMKSLDSRVNLIPIIAKSDTMTKTELDRFREIVLQELNSYGIQYYRFPINDQIVGRDNIETNKRFPLAVVGSNEMIKVGQQYLRARQYPWGVVQVENEEHCDVKRLRRCLIQNNILDLIETTHFKHYEYYRLHRLMKASFIETIDSSMISIVDALKNHHNQIHQDFQRREQILQQQCAEKVQQEEKKCNEKQKEIQSLLMILEKRHAEQVQHYEQQIRLLNEELCMAKDPKQTVNRETSKKNSKNKKSTE